MDTPFFIQFIHRLPHTVIIAEKHVNEIQVEIIKTKIIECLLKSLFRPFISYLVNKNF